MIDGNYLYYPLGNIWGKISHLAYMAYSMCSLLQKLFPVAKSQFDNVYNNAVYVCDICKDFFLFPITFNIKN